MAGGIDIVGIVSMLLTVIFAVVAYFLACFLGKKLAKVDKWLMTWLIFDAFIHFTMDLPFIFISLSSSVKESKHFLALPWKEYGKADKRFLSADMNLISMEFITVFTGALCVVLVHAIVEGKYYRHFIQIALCTCQLYGTWMTFCPEWLTGSRNLTTSNPLYLWVYMVFYNGLWVVIPIMMLHQSWKAQEHVKVVHPRTPQSPVPTDPAGRYSLRSKDARKEK